MHLYHASPQRHQESGYSFVTGQVNICGMRYRSARPGLTSLHSQGNFKLLQAPLLRILSSLKTEYLLCSLSARPPDQWHDSERQPRGQPRVFLQITSIEVFPNSAEFAFGLAKNSTHATYLETTTLARPSSLLICRRPSAAYWNWSTEA